MLELLPFTPVHASFYAGDILPRGKEGGGMLDLSQFNTVSCVFLFMLASFTSRKEEDNAGIMAAYSGTYVFLCWRYFTSRKERRGNSGFIAVQHDYMHFFLFMLEIFTLRKKGEGRVARVIVVVGIVHPKTRTSTSGWIRMHTYIQRSIW